MKPNHCKVSFSMHLCSMASFHIVHIMYYYFIFYLLLNGRSLTLYKFSCTDENVISNYIQLVKWHKHLYMLLFALEMFRG